MKAFGPIKKSCESPHSIREVFLTGSHFCNLKVERISCFIPTLESIDPIGSKSDVRGAKDPLVKKFTFSTFIDNFSKYKNLNFWRSTWKSKGYPALYLPRSLLIQLEPNLTSGAPRIPLSKSSIFQHLKTFFQSIKTSIIDSQPENRKDILIYTYSGVYWSNWI